jgi:hypothetical protein
MIILLEFSKEIGVKLLFGGTGAIVSVFLLNKFI